MLSGSHTKEKSFSDYKDIVIPPKRPEKRILVESVRPEKLDEVVAWTISTAKVIDTWSIIVDMDEESL